MRRRGLLIVLSSVLLGVLLAGTGLLYVRTRTAREQIRAFAERVLARELDLPVQLGGFSVSLGLGRVELRQLTIVDRATGAALLALERVRVGLHLTSLLRGEVRVKFLELLGPRLSVEDTPAFRDVLAGVVARLSELAREGARFPVVLEDGRLAYRNPALGWSLEVTGLGGIVSWQTPDRATALLTAEVAQGTFRGREIGGVRLELRAALARDALEVQRLALTRRGSALHLTGMVLNPGGPRRVELLTTGQVFLDELVPALGVEGLWRGRLSVEGKLFGEELPRAFEGRIGLDEGTVAGVTARFLSATVALGPERWSVTSLRAHAAGGIIEASGSFEPGESKWRGSARLIGVSLEEVSKLFKRPAPLVGQIAGRIEGSGQGAQLKGAALRLNLSGRELRLPEGQRRVEGELEGSVQGALLTVERLTLGRGRSRATLRGTVDLGTEAVALAATLRVADLAQDLWPWPVEGLEGSLVASGRVGQTLLRPLFSGDVQVRNLRFRGWRADQVGGPLEVGNARIASRSLRLSARRTGAVLSGEARLSEPERGWGRWREDLQLGLKLDLRGWLEDLVAWSQKDWPVTGPVLLEAQVSGTPSSLRGAGRLEMRELRIATERLESLKATLTFGGGELRVPRLTARRGDLPIQAEGAIDLDGSYRFVLHPVRLDPASVLGLAAQGPRGTIILRLWGAGRWPERRVEGELTLTDGALGGFTAGNGQASFSLDGEQWRWELSLAQGVRARGQAPVALNGLFHAEVTAADMDLAPFLRGVNARLPFPLTARADGRATLSAALPGFRGLASRIELASLRGQAGAVVWQARETAHLAWEAGTLRIEAVDLAGPGLSVAVRGSVRPGTRTDLELSGHAPYAIVAPWVPAMAEFRGTPEVRLSLVATPGELRVAGRAELTHVEAKLKAVPIWLSVASGEVRFDNDGVQVTVADGAAAGGRLEGQGVSRREGRRWRHTLEFRLDRAQLEQLYDQLGTERRWASGDLTTRARLAFDTAPGQASLPTLQGPVSVTLLGGSLSRYPALVRIFGFLGSPSQPYRLPDLTRERMPYHQITTDFGVKDGVMETKNLLLDSDVIRVSGVGKVSLVEQSVDLDLAARPLQVLEQGIRQIPLLGRVLPQEQGLAVAYFDMSGPWTDPKISAAPVKSLSQTVVDLLLLLLRAPERVIGPPR